MGGVSVRSRASRLCGGESMGPRASRDRGGATVRSFAARDAGGASVVVLAVGLLCVLVAGFFAAAGAAIVARHRAAGAADLAALAAAGHLGEGTVVACEQAERIATANAARLVSCRVEGSDVIVTTEVRPAGVAALAGVARARARAGPS